MARLDRWNGCLDGIEAVRFQNGTGQYFGVGRESNCIEARPGRILASCCGVNLVGGLLGGECVACASHFDTERVRKG